MFGTPATLIGMAGTALVLASAVPERFASHWRFGDATLLSDHVKADRLAPPVAAKARATVSTVEVIGLSNASVVLRDRNGDVLFRSDPVTNTTLIAKDAELPVITLKETATSSVVRQPVSPEGQEHDAAPSEDRRKAMPGCEGPVSPLVKQAQGRGPGLCVVQLETSGLS
jgi:hypothetical protein